MPSLPAKIAVLLPRFSRYGGVEQFGYRLASELAARGHRVDFICARQEIEAPGGVSVIRTGRPHGPRWLKMLVFACKAEALRQAGRYDCTISLGKTLNQDILRVGGCPLPAFWSFSERSYTNALSRTLKQLSRRTNPANILTRIMEKRQYANTKLVVAVSHFVKDLLVDASPELTPDTVRVIYNKPDLQRFFPPTAEQRMEARKQFGVLPHALAIGLATSNFQLKGVDPLIRSLQQLPENTVLYVAGGRGHGAYDTLARTLNLTNRVRFLGRVDAMPQWYQAMDVFALPTFYDACSNAVLEALASGLPVLSSASNGSSFFLPPENIVQNPGDSDELARVLSTCIAQAEENKKTGTRRLFSWPDGVAAGVDAFVETVEEFLMRKTNPLDPS